MEDAESLLRAAGAAICLLTAALLARDAGRTLAGRLGATFSLGVAAYMACSAPAFHELPGYIHVPTLTLCVINPVLFWLLARALFDDAFRLRLVHGLLVAAFLGLEAVHALAGGSVSTVSALLLHAAGFGLAAHALWLAYEGRADDLSEERRAFRMPFVIGVGTYSLVLVAAEIVLAGAIAPAPLRIVHVGAIVLLAVACLLRLVVLQGDELLAPRPLLTPIAPPHGQAPQSDESADATELPRLTALMEGKQAWRQEGLTIGRLADQLGLPEYRLRRLINKGLGHRNFAAYLNSYRIEAARAGLSDPAKRRLPVLTIALDLGFGSIGPFNRAFKEATGKTPTEFRRAHQGGGLDGLADS